MRKRLMVGLGVAAALVVLGATTYAAWTQGEAAGYKKGYSTGKQDERAGDNPRLTTDEVIKLVFTHTTSNKRPFPVSGNCEASAQYKGNGLWFVNVTVNQKAMAAWEQSERVYQTYLEEDRKWKAGEGNDAAFRAAMDAFNAVKLVPSKPSCTSMIAYAVSDRTGNVTGP